MPAPEVSQQATAAQAPRAPRALRAAFSAGLGLAFATLAATGTQNAVANGDNRTITLYHTHTKETTTVTFRRDGSYDREALRKLNWALRDWRRDEQIDMDPRLFDVVWQVTREIGSSEPLHVVSAYRSPQTNAALRRRSRGVAQQSQHMVGKAMDFYLPDADMGRVRAIAMRLQHGGVGFYPGAFNPFVHLDVGSVRSWPRMPRAQLARLFPDGKTVHLPADGKPLEGYELAKAEILARGGAVSGFAYAEAGEARPSAGRSFWAALFGGTDEDEDNAESVPSNRRVASGRAAQVAAAYAPSVHTNDAGIYSFVNAASQPAPAPAPRRPAPAPAQQVASVEPPAAPAPSIPAAPAAAIVQTAPQTARETVVAAAPAGSAQGFAPLPPVRNQVLAAAEPVLRAAPLPPRRGTNISPATPPVDGGALAALAAAATGPAPAAPTVMAYAPMPPMRGALPLTTGAVPAPAQVARQEHARQEPARHEPARQEPARTTADARRELQALFAAAVREAAPRRAARVANARVRTGEAPAAVAVAAPSIIVATRFAPGAPLGASDRFSGPAVQPAPVTSLRRN